MIELVIALWITLLFMAVTVATTSILLIWLYGWDHFVHRHWDSEK